MISQYVGSTFEASVLRYLLDEDYNDWDDANGDIDWDDSKITIPETPRSVSGSNYELSYGTPGWACAIDNSCDSRDSFLVTLESGLLPEICSAHRRNNIVQRVYEESLSKQHQKQDYVGHFLNKDSDGPAENCGDYNGKKSNRGAHSMHQVGCVTEDHTSKNCA